MQKALTRTQQGFEANFGVNHLGCFALTSLLLPALAGTAGSRVVVTASSVYRSAMLDWDNLKAERSYAPTSFYATSKLANMLFFFELDRRLRAAKWPISALGCHPGIAPTDLVRNVALFRILMPVVSPLLNTPAAAAWPALQAATGDVQSGDFYGPCGFRGIKGPSGKVPCAPLAHDPDTAERLWDLSVAMTGIDPKLPRAS